MLRFSREKKKIICLHVSIGRRSYVVKYLRHKACAKGVAMFWIECYGMIQRLHPDLSIRLRHIFVAGAHVLEYAVSLKAMTWAAVEKRYSGFF